MLQIKIIKLIRIIIKNNKNSGVRLYEINLQKFQCQGDDLMKERKEEVVSRI